MKRVVLLSISVLLLFALNAFAQTSIPGEEVKVASPPPPPPFVKACAFQNEGAACTFSDHSGAEVKGKCALRANPRGGQEMVCFNEAFFKKLGQGKREGRTGPELMN